MPHRMTRQLYGITGFALVTSDMDRLVAFYRDVLRLLPIGDQEGIEESEMAQLGLSGTGRRQHFMAGEQRLAIDQFTPAGRPYPADGNAASLWFQHFALLVDDIEAAYSQLRDAAPISVGGPQSLPASSGGVRAFKFRDPDGHPLEFLQKPGQSSTHNALVFGIDHSAISVVDIDASTKFFGDLGLRPGPRTLNHGGEQERLDALPAVEVDVAPMIPLAAAPHLELLGYRKPRGLCGPGRRANDVAATRIVWHGTDAGLLRDPDGHSHQVAPP